MYICVHNVLMLYEYMSRRINKTVDIKISAREEHFWKNIHKVHSKPKPKPKPNTLKILLCINLQIKTRSNNAALVFICELCEYRHYTHTWEHLHKHIISLRLEVGTMKK